MSMFWLHCNRCGLQPANGPGSTTAMFVSSCGHFFCDGCVNNVMSKAACTQCHTKPVRCVKLDKNLQPQIATMLEDPLVKIKQLYRAAEFQEMQIKQLFELYARKVSSMSRQVKDLSRQLDDERKKFEQAEEQRMKLHDKVAKLKAATTDNSHSSFPTSFSMEPTMPSPGADRLTHHTFDGLPNNVFALKTPHVFKTGHFMAMSSQSGRSANRQAAGVRHLPTFQKYPYHK